MSKPNFDENLHSNTGIGSCLQPEVEISDATISKWKIKSAESFIERFTQL